MEPKRVAIRPDSTGGKTLYMNVRSIRAGHTLLSEAAERFAMTIGLVTTESRLDTDKDGNEYISFAIGTGQRFTAFFAYDGMND